MSGNSPLLSVVIPVYNVEGYLRECIDSVLTQVGFDSERVEILAVDDGSTDGSGDILRDYESSGRIRLVSKENGGVSSARNVGLGHARGRYVLFMDSDDFLVEGSLCEVLDLLDENDVNVLWVEGVWLEEGRLRYACYDDPFDVGLVDGVSFLKRHLEVDHFGGAYHYICKRDFLLGNGISFESGRLYEDTVWPLDVLERCGEIFKSDIRLYVYRLGRPGSITTVAVTEKHCLDRIWVDEVVFERFLKYGLDTKRMSCVLAGLVERYMLWAIRNGFDFESAGASESFFWENLGRYRGYLRDASSLGFRGKYCLICLLGMKNYVRLWGLNLRRKGLL